MNGSTQSVAHGPANEQGRKNQQRRSVDLHHSSNMPQTERNGAMPITAPPRPSPGMPGEGTGGQGLAGPLPMPRSPPKNKSEYNIPSNDDMERRRWLRLNADTQHVP
ncbi:hypothetical protein KC352_g30287, partial [Hortaea werneckii]